MTGLRSQGLVLAAIALLLMGCSPREGGNAAPPRQAAEADIPVFQSRVALPVVIPVDTLERIVNEQVPRRLVTIDRPYDVCIKPVRVRIGERRIPVTPTIRCRVVGQVDRGRIRLSADRADPTAIRISFPVTAAVEAKDIGRIIRDKSGTASAEVRAQLRIRLDEQWRPVARIRIDYDWTEKPGIELLGRRFTFAGRADPELARLIADLERKLPARVQQLGLQKQAEDVWRKGFTSISVNRESPEVWLRLSPNRLSSGGFRVEGRQLVARLALEAGTETFIGSRPPDPVPTPLPPLARLQPGSYGVRFAAPVVADFAELEPVLAEELSKLSGESFEVPVAGRVTVNFGEPTIYTTSGGRLAIGLPMKVRTPRQILSTRGTVWLTGRPVNAPDSRKVRITDLSIQGNADNRAGRLLLAVAGSPTVLAGIESALAHDFEGDFQKLMTKINTVLGALPIGDFVATARVEGVRNGVVQPIGQGLFLPVEAYGEARLRYDPEGVRRIMAQREKDRAERAARRAEREAAETTATPQTPT